MSTRILAVATATALVASLGGPSRSPEHRQPVLTRNGLEAARATSAPARNSGGLPALKPAVLMPPCQGGAGNVTPCTTARSTPVNTPKDSATFTVNTANSLGESYNLACTFTTPVSDCNVTSFVDVLDPAHPQTVKVWYATSKAAGSGTVKLTATPTLYSTDPSWGTYTVTVTATYIVVTTPDNQVVRPAASTQTAQTFSVQNTGTASDRRYGLSVVCTGSNSSCLANQDSLTLTAGQAASVDVQYTEPLGPAGRSS
jgi:hypothetical protein